MMNFGTEIDWTLKDYGRAEPRVKTRTRTEMKVSRNYRALPATIVSPHTHSYILVSGNTLLLLELIKIVINSIGFFLY